MHLRNFIQITFLVLVIAIAPAAAAGVRADTPAINCCPDPRAGHLISRLEGIRDTNKATLAKNEKQNLRKEVKRIRKELKSIDGGVHFSLGVSIMIIFLLSVFLA
jgi:hypothetical protein